MSREEFAKWIAGTIIMASTLAIEQALDRNEPELTNDNINHYTHTIRGYLHAMEEVLEKDNEPGARAETT